MTTPENSDTDEGVGAAYPPPTRCPTCGNGLLVTRLQCPSCATEVSGTFIHPAAGGSAGGAPRLVNLPEPYASLLELFLRVRGNMKDVERELNLSYPTVRARLDEAFKAALPLLTDATRTTPSAEPPPPTAGASDRAAILGALERGELTAAEATQRLRTVHELYRS